MGDEALDVEAEASAIGRPGHDAVKTDARRPARADASTDTPTRRVAVVPSARPPADVTNRTTRRPVPAPRRPPVHGADATVQVPVVPTAPVPHQRPVAAPSRQEAGAPGGKPAPLSGQLPV